MFYDVFFDVFFVCFDVFCCVFFYVFFDVFCCVFDVFFKFIYVQKGCFVKKTSLKRAV